MLRLEARPAPSKAMSLLSPLIALAVTVLAGVALFALLGKDPSRGLAMFFVEPFRGAYAVSELCVKATPLMLIGLGLAVCYRANVWNIGAEGQFVLGAIAASGVAMHASAGLQPLDRRAHPAGRRAGRHGLGGHRRLAARQGQRERDPGQPDAGVRGQPVAELPGLRRLEGSGTATTSRRRSPSPTRPRSRACSPACA